jgi:repressor LexA
MTTTTLRPPTAKQRAVYDWIVAYYQRERVPPTVREIQSAFGVRSTTAIMCHVMPLVKKGWLERRPNRSRSILPTLEALAHADA